ncbi:MAG: TonB-dependent receptor plug domain-containing protein, partial [Kangiellaceae bacterium]|nr:TonB-dependent receptor plug domain-containing protein [Kangiellaceae bacterium]
MLDIKANKLSRAVALALFTGSVSLFAAEEANQDNNEDIEEDVVVGTRLQGTAQAVLEERKDQAFVADILGAEQISRTGDSDAAGALRRVTGLTLVDGRFIYVRGLGERFSSTQLDGFNVPSPDPTRSVLPLDLFPSRIIESLSVQKSYSPDLPAQFAGGNVDIRLKSIPVEAIFELRAQAGYNSNQSATPWYDGGSDDAWGRDDGTRAIPGSLATALAGDGINSLSNAESVAILGDLNRDISGDYQSVDNNFGFSLTG